MNLLNNIFEKTANKNIIGLTNELKALYIYYKHKQTKQNIIFVTSSLNDASKIYNELNNHTKNVWFFPMDDFLTSQALAISPELKNTRLETIGNIIEKQNGIIITNLMGYLRYLPQKENFKKSYINIKVGDKFPINDLIQKLYNIGYTKETSIKMTGEIALRGCIIDIFPLNYDNPIRIEFWGDIIDLIRIFDVTTQRTIKNIDEICIYPNTELLIENNEDIKYHEMPKYTSVTNIEKYLKNPVVIYDNYTNLKLSYKSLIEEIFNYNIGQNRPSNQQYMNDFNDVENKNAIIFEDVNTALPNAINYNVKDVLPFKKGIESLPLTLKQYQKNKKTIIIALYDRYQANKIIESIKDIPNIFTNINQIYDGKINIIIQKLNQGFETENYLVLTPREIFNIHEQNTYKTKFRFGSRIKDISKLSKGDYIVHGAHGIGRYLGLKTITKNGLKKDYLTIEYLGGDKLYIPVEKIELISKFSGKEGIVPRLNKLGSKEWQKTKAKARKRAENIAEDLLKLYAIREAKKGFAFNKDNKEQIEFEKEFEYVPTADQIKVIDEIKKDMESSKPMDRLLCGDVGYGKTEVAFRAIFKCIISGKQAAILCPTTILSTQHYQNAVKRYESFNVKIAVLNRFISIKNAKKILNDLEKGEIDLLIGTHRILSDDVKFKDLGLLVIDEEQRFGVKHKEKIKNYKNNIDVLTLSATPIPRTLQMSIAGIRSLSMIETPPAERYPIQTYVLEENNQIIKEAINKELARNGQIYVLFNNIESMQSQQAKLMQLVPDIKIEIAHGRMPKQDLEKVMDKFNKHEFDCLLCTTIIETGIDIANVNTLIIMDADHFGLSQLYQIRGRIGRSNKIGYCYLMYKQNKILSEISTKRLKVIKDFTSLGSGFAIAMRDLSIRGAGDLLGQEQAGFIDSVGIELFLEMLNEEIRKAKGEKIETKEEQQNPLIDIETSIEDNYVNEDELKIEIHKKINTIDSEQKLNEVKEEIEDRFGKISETLKLYMYEELFEKEAQKLGITQIRQTKNFIELTLPKEITKKIDGQNLFLKISKLSKMFRFSQKEENLLIILDIMKLDKHFLYYLLDLLKIIKESKIQ